MIRLFAGLPVPEAIGAQLTRIQRGVPRARWRRPDQFHITLAFIGEVNESVAEDIDTELGRISVAPFEIALRSAGSFGGEMPHALWMGVDAGPSLELLHNRCKRACRDAGVTLESGRYQPHLTMAYLWGTPDLDRVQAFIRNHGLFSSPTWLADRFYLYSSHLGAKGSHYAIEAEYPLIG